MLEKGKASYVSVLRGDKSMLILTVKDDREEDTDKNTKVLWAQGFGMDFHFSVSKMMTVYFFRDLMI